MRSLIAVTVLCLTSLPAFACVLDSDCETGTMCLDGVCTHGLSSDIGDDNVPPKRASPGRMRRGAQVAGAPRTGGYTAGGSHRAC